MEYVVGTTFTKYWNMIDSERYKENISNISFSLSSVCNYVAGWGGGGEESSFAPSKKKEGAREKFKPLPEINDQSLFLQKLERIYRQVAHA